MRNFTGLWFGASALLMGCTDKATGLTIHNTTPAATITQPVDESEFREAEAIEFIAMVGDSEQSPDTLSLMWSSDIDGVLGSSIPDSSGDAQLALQGLSPGVHLITLTVQDDQDGMLAGLNRAIY